MLNIATTLIVYALVYKRAVISVQLIVFPLKQLQM